MLKLIATQAPDPSGVADNSITSSSSDNAASPVQAAFAQLLAEISSPEVLTVTAGNVPIPDNIPVAPSLPSPTPKDAIRGQTADADLHGSRGFSSVLSAQSAVRPRIASLKPAPNDVQTVPVAGLMVLVQHSFQVTSAPDVTRLAAKTHTINIDSVGKPLPPGTALANSIHVEVESASPPPTALVPPTGTIIPRDPMTSSGTVAPAAAPRLAPITMTQPAMLQVSAPALAIPAAEHPVETTSNLAPVRQDAQALTGVTPDVLTKVAASGQKQAWQESSSDDPKRNSDSSDRTTLSWNPSAAGTTSKFDSHLAAVEAPRSATPVREMPQMPTPISAHKVSIDIGDKESKVIVTLHERAGDVSVKVHAANDTLKTQLQSSVGSLVESLNRANVSLKNVDFSSGYGTTTPDPDQRNAPRYEHLAPRAKGKNTRPERDAGDSVRLSSV